MSTDNWVIMATAMMISIATVAGPIISEWMRSRRHQPNPTPETSMAPSARQGRGGWLRRSLASPWLLVLPVVLNVWSLVQFFSSPKPLDRWGVLFIALSVSLILFMAVWMLVLLLLREYHRRYIKEFVEQAEIELHLLETISDLAKDMNASDRAILNLVTLVDAKTTLAEKVSAAANALPPKRPTQDAFDRIRAALNRLLE